MLQVLHLVFCGGPVLVKDLFSKLRESMAVRHPIPTPLLWFCWCLPPQGFRAFAEVGPGFSIQSFFPAAAHSSANLWPQAADLVASCFVHPGPSGLAILGLRGGSPGAACSSCPEAPVLAGQGPLVHSYSHTQCQRNKRPRGEPSEKAGFLATLLSLFTSYFELK